MTESILPIPIAHVPVTPAGETSGEGAQTALASMIRKRRMRENPVEPDLTDPVATQVPGT